MGIEILIGLVATLVTQILKKLTNVISDHFGWDVMVAGAVSQLLVFVVVFAGVSIYQTVETFHPHFWVTVTGAFISAIAIYEVILKRLPVVGNDR